MRIDIVLLVLILALVGVGWLGNENIQVNEDLNGCQVTNGELITENENLRAQNGDLQAENQTLQRENAELERNQQPISQVERTVPWIIQAGLISMIGMQAIVIRRRNTQQTMMRNTEKTEFILLNEAERKMIIQLRRNK